MSKLERIGNDKPELPQVEGYTTKAVQKVISLGNKDISEMSEAEMDLYIARERLKAERDAVAKIRGIGSLKTQGYQDSVDTIEDAIQVINDPDADLHIACIDEHITQGRYSNARFMNGIGDSNTIFEKRRAIALGRAKDREAAVGDIGKRKKLKEVVKNVKTKTGKFLKKVAEKAKTGAKAVVKAVTLPQRLVAKAILEVTLPKAAPFFLYLFINDAALIAKLPEKARKKRKKAEKMADFIVNGIGMKRNHFMGIVRTGIIKQMGKSPETIIAAQIGGKKLSGIGDIGNIYGAAFTALIEIIGKLVSIFKKKKPDEDVTAADGPSPDDFAGMSEKDTKTLASDVKKQSDNQDFDKDTEGGGGSGKDHNESGGRKVWKSF